MWLHGAVKFSVQRCDIARFLILHYYGGMYADLDIFPNRATYPQVSLGFPKIASRASSQLSEYEMEAVVATRGNVRLLEIVANMVDSYRERMSGDLELYYRDKPCRFIYQTTGPKALSRWIRESHMADKIHFFAMNRPEKDISVENLYCDQASSQRDHEGTKLTRWARASDILSAFSMSYRSQLSTGVWHVPVASPGWWGLAANGDLPEFPPAHRRRIVGKRPTHSEPAQCKQQRLALASEAAQVQVVPCARPTYVGQARPKLRKAKVAATGLPSNT